MLTYRGDKFVKGKKFTINETAYRFSKRDDEKLIFESISDGSKFIMTEEEFNEAERVLTEKINQENKEINEIIGKVLRSKGLARKYEDILKSKGITVNYDSPQGVSLVGPNGKHLSATSKIVIGPSKPGQAGTHEKGNTTYWEPEYNEYKEKVAKLKAMKRDDIIRAHSDLDSKEALKKHREELKQAQERLNHYRKEVEDDYSEAKKERREGHLEYPGSGGSYSHPNAQFNKERADSTVDYLNYLTKPNTGDDFRNNMSYHQRGGDDEGYANNYQTKNPVSNEKSDSINKYNSLKHDVKDAEGRVKDRTYNKDDYYSRTYGAMTDKQLEKRISDMKKELEKKIAELQKEHDEEVKDVTSQNVENRKNKEEAVKNLKAKEKELDNFLKSKGIRESVLDIINGNKLTEGEELDFRAGYEEIYGEKAEYTQMRQMIEALEAIAEQADEDNYRGIQHFEDAIRLLSSVYEDLEEFYERN